MRNRKFILFLFIFGVVLFLAGIQTGKNIESPKSETLGEQSASQISSSSSEPVQNSENPQNLYKVLKVIDGDTIDLEIEGKKESVRLIGIDAPESNQCFGKEATERAKELLSSKTVSLEADSTQGERDKYRRLLRYVFVDGVNFEEIMVREGFAKEYTYNKPYKYQSLYKTAQVEAQNNKRGLWADGACSLKSAIEPKPAPSSSNNQNFTCDCSKLCSQIQTCDEAYFQLNQCGCTKRDSDKDGVPCESLCK